MSGGGCGGCGGGKSASARHKPSEALLAQFMADHDISAAEWQSGNLRRKGIREVPAGLPWPEGLQVLNLSWKQIVDVSAFSLPEELQVVFLSGTQIVDVSALSLPEGLQVLNLSGNQIVDLSALSVPDGCRLLQ